MSSEIIYRRFALKYGPSDTGLEEDIFVLAAVQGSSNTTTVTYDRNNRPHERLSRDWRALAAGTAKQVMRRVIEIGCSTYGGCTKVGSRQGDTKGSTFVAGSRRILAAAVDHQVATLKGRRVWATFGIAKAGPHAYGNDPFDGTLREYFAREDIRAELENGTFHRRASVGGPDE